MLVYSLVLTHQTNKWLAAAASTMMLAMQVYLAIIVRLQN